MLREFPHPAEDLDKFVRSRIERLRPKLLDLSRRNPLVSTKFSPRSTSYIRIVDELPDILYFTLSSQEQMRFIPLPPLDDHPKDEDSRVFQEALSNARLTDETYLRAPDKLDSSSENHLEEGRQLERDLRDRLREQLGMPPRQTKSSLSLTQHAKNNNISPSYELPDAHEEHEDGRHSDSNIQTLLLPDDLERKLNALIAKCRTWVQETGINVLRAAFGLLEYRASADRDNSIAPLVLLPVTIEKRKKPDGFQYWLTGTGDEAETNIILAEKLRQDFGIELPQFEAGSTEDYFDEISQLTPPSVHWKVRRQVAFGVFPSARMSMYFDLDTNRTSFSPGGIVSSLFGGTESGTSTPFAEEYDIDDPEIERHVPWLVRDADSSQFSTIVDVAKGRNIAVEGPPGTGKSQTIVNTIATALGQGKKVLFVAAKLAALDVVKSRLEAVRLGEFVLALQADRSARERVIQSLRDRLEMNPGRISAEYDSKVSEFRGVRSQLAAYIDIISMKFGQTGLSIYEILGKSIKTSCYLEGMPRELQTPIIAGLLRFDRPKIDSLRVRGQAMQCAWRDREAALPHWRDLAIPAIDRFTADRLCQMAEHAAKLYGSAALMRQGLLAFAIDPAIPTVELQKLQRILAELIPIVATADVHLVGHICREGRLTEVQDFLRRCKETQSLGAELGKFIADASDRDMGPRLRALHALCTENDIEVLDMQEIRSRHRRVRDQFAVLKEIEQRFRPFIALSPEHSRYSLTDLIDAHTLLMGTPRHALALRSETTADPQASIAIKRVVKEGRRLGARRSDLESFISVGRKFPQSDIISYAVSLRDSGFFRSISHSFKIAKRAYASLSHRSTFRAHLAAGDLFALSEWLDDEQDFLADKQALDIFGIHFRGVDTDFDMFDDLLEFYEKVDLIFAGAKNAGFRDFLKIGKLDLILSIPDTKDISSDCILPDTFHDLRDEIEKSEAWASAFEDTIAELENLISCLKYNSNIIVSSLPAFADGIDAYGRLIDDLDNNESMQALLRDQFRGAKTKHSGLGSSIAAAAAIASPETKEMAALRILEEHQVVDCHETVTAALEAEEKAVIVLDELCCEAFVEREPLTKHRGCDEIATLLDEASRDREGLFIHSGFETARRDLDQVGFGWVAEALLRDGQPLDHLPDLLEAVVIRALAIEVNREHGSTLARSNGVKLDTFRAELAKLDKDIIKMSRQRLRHKIHGEARPPHGKGIGKKSSWTEMALIHNEVSKKQRFVPLRDLASRAMRALLELKPCWMMSPLAVAQYLPQEAALFDLCIIDEASQMPPEEAIGALVRSGQVMVVGDTNQLPPTNFFRKMVDDEEDDEDEVTLEESILEMANGTFRPKRRLRWHYRSRHSALIRFSNSLVYNNDLIVFPAPTEGRPGMGVSRHKICGRYSAGTNSDEASAMIKAIIRFMRLDPNRSLGVVTLNQKQRDLLQEEMDFAIKFDSVAADYIERWKTQDDGLNSFFIKNLENVQGDERDVIYIGTVYGPESPGGSVMQRFGPINGLAGMRRLNVLFSRAREQIVTFSSMSSDDIKADQHGNAGAHMLKRWLEYCETGILHGGEQTNKEPDSDFEIYVIEQIRAMGCEAVPQVGVAGYFVDIGVKHHDWPHGFLMGVECDGATYHSARSARDRDRLRQEILEGLGWHIHRIWSTDWFTDPAREASRLRSAIEKRLDDLKAKAADWSIPQEVATSFDGAPDDEFSATADEENRGTEVGTVDAIAGDIDSLPLEKPKILPAPPFTQQKDYIEVGDRVRVRYLTQNQTVIEVTISDERNDPDSGILHESEPLAEALLGAEEGDEVEVLVGSYLRRALVENVTKGHAEKGALKASISSRNPASMDTNREVANKNKSPEIVHGSGRSEPPAPPSTDSLSADLFYNPSYLPVLREYAKQMVDFLGPITFHYLSHLIARAHGFQRTGPEIKRRTWSAISKWRRTTKGPNDETIIWAQGCEPQEMMPFRGLSVGGFERSWQDVSYPEKLGLAHSVVIRYGRADDAAIRMMSDRIGLTRLRQSTRDELSALLQTANSSQGGS